MHYLFCYEGDEYFIKEYVWGTTEEPKPPIKAQEVNDSQEIQL